MWVKMDVGKNGPDMGPKQIVYELICRLETKVRKSMPPVVI